MLRLAQLPICLALCAPLIACGAPQSEAEPVDTAGFVERGAEVYAAAGCVSCHGDMGEEPTLEGAPSLEVFVSRFGLESQADLDAAVELLASGRLHDPDLETSPPFDGFEQVTLAARVYEDLIAGDGHDGVFVQFELREPMPQWGETLSDRDIEALMAYLLVRGSN